MKTYHLQTLVLALLSALLSISCGVSGSGTIAAGGGIGGSGIISVGTITAFGSIVVNGTEFDTSNAVIIVEGEEIGVGDDIVLDNLDIGMVVTVEGTGSEDGESAVADRVIYNDNVEGPVQSIPFVNDTRKDIVVLGQTVILNTVTVFKGTIFDEIAVNDVVEVSGLCDYTGDIWATFLEKTDGVIFEVTGFVDNLDPVQKTFKINDLTVDYSSADTSGLPGGLPADGLLVEVEGTLDPDTGEMLADVIELGDELDAEDADAIEVTGFVTDFVSAFEFTVGTQVVRTDADTVFVDGTADDIALGVKLEAEGSLEDGILFAEEVEFWGPDQIEVEGLVTDIVSPSEFTVGDQVVQTDAETVYEGGTPDDIALGVNLEIKGVPVDIIRSILVADKVSFEDEEFE
ncbi:MAG: hypothetical protein E3J26_04645 [Candidatus Zixiibacteriota bacterium]|nr:MAG: hypothetical protein E3J26_04645 [candidate division Zixibacteria bacterium]